MWRTSRRCFSLPNEMHDGRRPGALRVVVGLLAIVVIAAGVTLAFVIGVDQSDTSTVERARARPAPEFRLSDLRDESTVLARSQFAGRPLVINFWASWCVPCRREMPALEAAFRRYGGAVSFVGIDTRDGSGPARRFARRTGVRYPLARDFEGGTADDYGVFGLPTTVFVDASGREIARHVGELSGDDLNDALRRLYGGASAR